MADPINPLQNPVVDSIAKELGVDAARVAEALGKRQKAGEIVIPSIEDPVLRGQAGAQAMERYVNSRLADPEMPQALGSLLAGACHRMGVREVPPERVPSRPKEKGLPAAIFSMADAAEQMPQEMHLSRVNVPVLRETGTRIVFYRSVLAELLMASDLILDNLTVVEREAADTLTVSYGKVREAAGSERKLGNLLTAMEDYQVGSQKLGAEVRAKNLAREMQMTEKATRKARLSAGSEARKDIADNLTVVLEELLDRRRDDRYSEGGGTPLKGR